MSISNIDGVFEGLSFEQLQCFVAVADHGSFSAAARALRRAQSAVSSSIQRLEEQFGVTLFDRSGYRPTLTVAGAALLLRARRIAGEIGGLRAQARSLASGIEAEVVLTLDSHYPMEGLFIVLRRFRDFWPMVQLKILVDNMGAAAEQVLEGRSSLGVLSPLVARHPAMIFKGISPQVQLTIVAAPCHPLAAWEGVIPAEELSRHVQLVLTDRSTLLAGQDFGVLSPQTWRIGDLGAKLAMLRAGFGWGSMPLHMIGDDLNARRLVRIHPVGWGEGRTMTMFLAQRIDAVLGPAGTWLADRLTEPSS